MCVGGGGWVCKPNLVLCFGPNQAYGLGLRPGPSQTIFQQQNNELIDDTGTIFAWIWVWYNYLLLNDNCSVIMSIYRGPSYIIEFKPEGIITFLLVQTTITNHWNYCVSGF